MIKSDHVFFLFLNMMKTTPICSLKIILYLTLFLKIIFKAQQLNNIRNFLKHFSIYFLNYFKITWSNVLIILKFCFKILIKKNKNLKTKMQPNTP